MLRKSTATWFVLVFITCLGINPAPSAQAQTQIGQANPTYRVFAFNDLGMHCYDQDFSVFSLLPPFNVVHAQVVTRGKKPRLLNNTQTRVTYAATADPSGSIDATSIGKTNFWSFIAQLFGPTFTNWPLDVGILKAKMPSGKFGPQPLVAYDAEHKWFSAPGIPITNIDDNGKINNFPMMKIRAFTKGGAVMLSSLDIVVPTSSEMNCVACHETEAFVPSNPGSESDASPPPRLTSLTAEDFSSNPDPNIRFRENILILHDALSQTNLMTAYQAGNPTLCAQCHYSKALDLAGNDQPTGDQVGHLYLSRAMHKHHGTAWPTEAGEYEEPIPGVGVERCYFCHPGNDTQCLRSVMAVKGMQCQRCHGDLLEVGGFTPQLAEPGFVDPFLPNVSDPKLVTKLTSTGEQRRPWMDLPKCQSCHSGDALNHLGNDLIGRMAFDPKDPAATPLTAANPRFAENPGQLFRFSQTHGGMACESCHGSPHAEWPARIKGNDNITAIQLQGHTGEISECNACHTRGLPPSLGGPHGLHNVNDPGWMKGHGVFWKQNPASCQACHGTDLKGTVLSRAKATRNLTRRLPKGVPVSCLPCHLVFK